MKTYLKIKIKSLAAEAVIIKQEERKWKSVRLPKVDERDDAYTEPHPIFWGLRFHRLNEVRTECRSTNIAYGYLRGRAYKQIENKCYQEPNWQRIENIIAKYSVPAIIGPEARKELAAKLKSWREAKEIQEMAA